MGSRIVDFLQYRGVRQDTQCASHDFVRIRNSSPATRHSPVTSCSMSRQQSGTFEHLGELARWGVAVKAGGLGFVLPTNGRDVILGQAPSLQHRAGHVEVIISETLSLKLSEKEGVCAMIQVRILFGVESCQSKATNLTYQRTRKCVVS